MQTLEYSDIIIKRFIGCFRFSLLLVASEWLKMVVLLVFNLLEVRIVSSKIIGNSNILFKSFQHWNHTFGNVFGQVQNVKKRELFLQQYQKDSKYINIDPLNFTSGYTQIGQVCFSISRYGDQTALILLALTIKKCEIHF